MKELTKAEQQVMQILWDIEKGFVHDIIEKMPNPKPAYNTVSTIVRILVKKEFVGYTAHGKTHEYHPLVAKEEYSKQFLNNFLGGYFGGSFKNLVSFFAKEENMDAQDLDELMNYVKKNMKEDEK
ncbi:BlaI/MecI/CopY family transcriptional regulator [Reichenbachiella ulvae]|uniref:BlaI/MecI/CopY family transcriptional regulator n=1 Tax=Reichenbachiella ulvae TaxID=2980104 RepID=A0ABT3CXU1_9BACT|nr:BlaI/MecI/CopY family transcriptional regulator [Reichenbachiella ulvae]MCV9388396.1 BlaI/MecI/CopY family transcriptional regulator [Reichenbachiella ulvae]